MLDTDLKIISLDYQNNFGGIFDNLTKIISLDYQNNFIGILKTMNNAAKSFDILTINLSILYNYFDSSTKFFKSVSN